ncbi:MAG: capsular polysaccharide biosynthesis protein [Flammeovirgaceae bacterium]
MIFSFFKKNKLQKDSSISIEMPVADMHSHLLPSIDDGAKDLEHSLSLIKELIDLGYKKLITTPHIMQDFYKNTPEIILEKLQIVREALLKEKISIEIDAAAEYYLDEYLMEKLRKQEKLLTFGKNYLLFETSFMNASSYLNEAIFLMQSSGYRPIFAHPERYVYLFDKYKDLMNIRDKGVYLQINLNSLSGYYSKESKKVAEKLIEDKAVDFVGTDCHHEKHINSLHESRKSKYFEKLMSLPLLNSSLLK